jgi:uncharacterized protein YecE (DUF72 family)
LQPLISLPCALALTEIIFMDFGRIQENELNKVDFGLPVEPAWNKEILKGVKKKNPKIYIGCAKWGRKEWIGKIYPRGTKDAQFLDEYVKHYNCIELNASHYKLYSADDIKKWAAKSQSSDFLFCPKVYQGISHFGNLKDKQFLTDTFLAGITAFEENLGPIFLQVSDKFSPKRRDELVQYLQSLPEDLQFFLEVRHPGWFSQLHFNELMEQLKKLKIGLVITDTAGRRDCCHMHVTVPKVFIRYVGNSLHPTDYKRIDDWVKRIQYWFENGLTELYFFMHMHDEAFSPELSVYLIEQLNKLCKLHLKKPQFIEPPKTLFE